MGVQGVKGEEGDGGTNVLSWEMQGAYIGVGVTDSGRP